MNFLLKNIELEINDEVLQAGERLIAKDAVKQLAELDKNLWVCQIDDTTTFEVEVMVTRQNVKAMTCDCPVADGKTGFS